MQSIVCKCAYLFQTWPLFPLDSSIVPSSQSWWSKVRNSSAVCVSVSFWHSCNRLTRKSSALSPFWYWIALVSNSFLVTFFSNLIWLVHLCFALSVRFQNHLYWSQKSVSLSLLLDLKWPCKRSKITSKLRFEPCLIKCIDLTGNFDQ